MRPSLSNLGVSTFLLAVLLGTGGLIPGWIMIAQTTTTAPKSFEVASIRPGNPNSRNTDLSTRQGGRVSATNLPLIRLILYAYDIKPEQLDGLPSWAKSRTYTIQAKGPPDMPKMPGHELAQVIHQMLRSLLADRFKLMVHNTTRQLPVYEMVVVKGGPKLKPSTKADFVAAGHEFAPGDTSISMSNGQMNALGVSVAMLADILSRRLGRAVIDKTGLTGRYDFTLKWDPSSERVVATNFDSEPSMPTTTLASGPSIYTALQEQLGLKLKPGKGPVQVLVVDHIEPPTAN